MGKVIQAKARLEEVYIAYGEEDADFDALAAEQAELEAIIATAGTDSEHQLEIAADALAPATVGCSDWCAVWR
jgi:sulfate-transporting ATPase